MHGQLAHANIHHGHQDLAAQQVAQGAAARHIGTVGKGLHRHPGLFADGGKGGTGQAAGGVALAGIVLEDDAAAHVHRQLLVALFRVVGMDGVAVVGAEQQAVGAGADALLLRHTKALLNAGQHIAHQAALCALPAGRAHFLVVEHHPDVAAARFLTAPLQETIQGGIGTFQVVDAAGHEIFALQAHTLGLFGDAEHQVGGQDVLCLSPGFGGKGVLQAAALGPEDGLQVHLGVVVQAGVGHAGQCPLRVYQTALHAVGGAHQQAACHAQGPVEPGGHQHAAIALHLGAGKAVVGPVQRLDAPGGRVTVAGCGVPAGERAFGHPPGQNGRAVAGGVVFAAGHKVPYRALRAVPVALGFQNGRGGRRRVERADTGVQKRKQIFHGKCFVLHGDASFRFYWFYSL